MVGDGLVRGQKKRATGRTNRNRPNICILVEQTRVTDRIWVSANSIHNALAGIE
jgi:hypothetical protein